MRRWGLFARREREAREAEERSRLEEERKRQAAEEEKRALMADIKDVYAEAKANGFEPKIMRQVVRLRSMDRDLLNEQDALLDTYRDALGLR